LPIRKEKKMAEYEVEIHYILTATVEADSETEAFDLVDDDEMLKDEMVVKEWHASEVKA